MQTALEHVLLAFVILELPAAGRWPAAADANDSFVSSLLRIFVVTVGPSQRDMNDDDLTVALHDFYTRCFGTV